MGEEAKNVEILRKAYTLWHDSKGDSFKHWIGIVADDIKFGSLAEGAEPLGFAKNYTGRAALQEYFAGLLGEWEMIHYTTHDFIAQGDAVFVRVLTEWRNKRTRKTVATPKADFWRFRNGEIVEFYEYYDTARLAAAAA